VVEGLIRVVLSFCPALNMGMEVAAWGNGVKCGVWGDPFGWQDIAAAECFQVEGCMEAAQVRMAA
jgi:hypothetical protein